MKFLEDVKCKAVCRTSYTGGNENSEKKLQLLKEGIAMNYQHHWIVGKVLKSFNEMIKNTYIYLCAFIELWSLVTISCLMLYESNHS